MVSETVALGEQGLERGLEVSEPGLLEAGRTQY